MLKTLLLIASSLASSADSGSLLTEMRCTALSSQPEVVRLTFDPVLTDSDPDLILEVEKILSSKNYDGPSIVLTNQNSMSVGDFYVTALNNESDVPLVAAVAAYNNAGLDPSGGGTVLLGFENIYFSNLNWGADRTVAESLIDVISGPSTDDSQETLCFVAENSCVSLLM